MYIYRLGYDGLYFARRHGYEEGGATFYRLSRFTLESHKELGLGEALQQVRYSNLFSSFCI